jgi:hypothetical protein
LVALVVACGDDSSSDSNSEESQSVSDTCFGGADAPADACCGDPCCGAPCCNEFGGEFGCDSGMQCMVDADCGAGFVCQGGVCTPIVPGALNECETFPMLADSTFGAGVPYQPGALATADLDDDGSDELLIARTDGIAIWTSLGGAMFDEAGPYPTQIYGRPRGMGVAELSGDTLLDIVVLGEGQPGSIGRLYGDVTSTFLAQPVIQAGANPSRLAMGDIDDDGLLDLVLMSTTVTDINVVHVLLADGDGGFLVPIDVTLAQAPLDMQLVEITGDGKLDLAIANAQGVAVMSGRGTGGFDDVVQLGNATGAIRGAVTVADLDGNGAVEIVRAADLSGIGEVASWTFAGATTDPTPAHTWQLPLGLALLATGDLDGDGRIELLAGGQGPDGVTPITASVVWMPTAADGTLMCQHSFALPKPSEALLVADIDGDGKLDIGTASGVDTLTLLLSSG